MSTSSLPTSSSPVLPPYARSARPSECTSLVSPFAFFLVWMNTCSALSVAIFFTLSASVADSARCKPISLHFFSSTSCHNLWLANPSRSLRNCLLVERSLDLQPYLRATSSSSFSECTLPLCSEGSTQHDSYGEQSSLNIYPTLQNVKPARMSEKTPIFFFQS